jgi:O-antigen/teichoic acid export membrane protein
MKASSQDKKENKELFADAAIQTEASNPFFFLPKDYKKRLHSLLNNKQLSLGGGALVTATFLSNILNYVFNAYLGRVLSFSDFALIGLISSFLSLSSILFGAYAFIVNYTSSFLIGKYGEATAYGFWRSLSKRSIYPSLILGCVWLLFTPILINFFHTNNIFLFLLFSLVLLVGLFNNANQGFLASKLLFGSLAIIGLVDPIVKLTATFTLASFGLTKWAFAAMVLSFLVVTFVGWFLIAKQVPHTTSKKLHPEARKLPKKLFFLSILTSFSSVAYFTFDIFLAKHFLTPTGAGEYTLVSLVGKMIFFLGNLIAPFITPFISRYEGANKNSLHALYLIIAATSLFTFVGFVLFGIFGYITVPLLYGERARLIVPYVPLFTFGMACYSVSGAIVNYYLIRKIYSFTIITSFLVFLQVGLIALFHNSVGEIATVMSFVLMANLLVTLMLHINVQQVKSFEKRAAHSVYTFIQEKKYHKISYFSLLRTSVQHLLLKENR